MDLLKNTLQRYRSCGTRSERFTETGDAIVSDVNPDVMTIVNTEAKLILREKQPAAGGIRVAGELVTQIYYQAYEEQELFVTTARLPFSHLCQMECGEQDLAEVEVQLLQISAGLLNPRKVTCRAELALQATVYRAEQYTWLEDLQGSDREKLQCKYRTLEETALTGIAQKRVTAVDTLRLPGAEIPADGRLLRWQVTWLPEETRVLSKKVMVRGSARIDVTAADQACRQLQHTCHQAPFSQIVECPEVEPGDQVTLGFCPTNSSLRLVTRTEGGCALEYDLTADMTVKASRKVTYQVLEDAYSIAYQTDTETRTLELEGEQEVRVLEKTVTEELITEGVPVRIQDIALQAFPGTLQAGARTVAAEQWVKVLYERSDGLVCAASKRVPVDFELPEVSRGGSCRMVSDGVTGSIGPDGSVNVSFRAALELAETAGTVCTVLHSCKLDPERPKTVQRRGSLILRNVAAGEQIWTIAKQYNTSPAQICAANRLEPEQEPEAGQLLIIPFVV